jgi:hypothetical protein
MFRPRSRLELAGVAGPIGEEFSMRFMKPVMAIAAVCVAMLSMTMVVKRKRQGQKGRRPRG